MTAVIGYGNRIDSVTVTDPIGTYAAGYGIANVKNRFLSVPARNTAGLAYITMDLGVGNVTQCVGVAGLSITGGTFTVKVSTDNFASSDITLVSTQTQTAYGSGTSWFATFDNPGYRYFRIVIAAGAAPFDIGRVFVGQRFRPGYGLSFGAGLGLEDRTVRDESSGGARFHVLKTPRRTLMGEFEALTDAEAAAWRSIMRTYGSHSEYVLVWDDADTSANREDRNMLCNIDELSDVEYPNATMRKVGMKLSEIIA